MSLPRAFLSKPAVTLPETSVDNDEVVRRIRACFRGSEARWRVVEAAVRHVFATCASSVRYLEPDPGVRVADFTTRAVRACLAENGAEPRDLDLVVYGGIARDYFEPATATEVAAKLGLEAARAFDVTCACVGQLEAVHVVLGLMGLHDEIRTALVCAGELTRDRIAYDIQSARDLVDKAAGLTLGNAATAMLVRREPFVAGGLEIAGLYSKALPAHWQLCTVPVDGTFRSQSTELFKLGVHAAPELTGFLASLGWSVAEVEHYVFHQPSETVVRGVLADLGLDESRAPLTHRVFGNTASTSVPLAFRHRLDAGSVRDGDRVVLSAAAAGFSMAAVAGVWSGPRELPSLSPAQRD
jgi:3-oxoacyl-[acyl-carrier-protein] synthase-3